MDEASDMTGLSEPHLSEPFLNRACSCCARAKAKCIPGHEADSKCQRCHRLKKLCEPAAPRVRAPPRKRKTAVTSRVMKTHVEKLEEKLDGLVTLLKSNREAPLPIRFPDAPVGLSGSEGRQSHSVSASTTSEPSGYEISRFQQQPNNNSNTSSDQPAINLVNRLTVDACLHANQGGNSSNSSWPPLSELEIHEADYDCLLNIFRTEMCQAFPFILIDDAISAQDLRQNQPFLYTAILSITTRNTIHQKEYGRHLMKQLAERLYVNGERNMDLLLGTLTYGGWCYHHFYNVPQLTILITAATALVNDLGLHRHPSGDPPSLFEHAIREVCPTHKLEKKVSRTLTEQRAFLGCFYLSSVASLSFHRIDTLRQTPYIDKCCHDLTEAAVHQNDNYAVALVKVQKISERINQAPWHGNSDMLEVSYPLMLFVKPLREQLQAFRREISAELFQASGMALAFYSAEISLYKVGLSRSAFPLATNQGFDRLELLHACLQSVKNFFDVFLAIPPSKYHCISMPVFCNVTLSMIGLQMLSAFDHTDWDLNYARQTISLSSTLLALSERFETASRVLGFDRSNVDGNNMFMITARKMRCIDDFCRAKMSNNLQGRSQTAEVPVDELLEFSNTGAGEMEILDEAFLSDILGPWGTEIQAGFF